jgi:hypothetical protein
MFAHAFQGGPCVLIIDSKGKVSNKDKKSHTNMIKIINPNLFKNIYD